MFGTPELAEVMAVFGVPELTAVFGTPELVEVTAVIDIPEPMAVFAKSEGIKNLG